MKKHWALILAAMVFLTVTAPGIQAQPGIPGTVDVRIRSHQTGQGRGADVSHANALFVTPVGDTGASGSLNINHIASVTHVGVVVMPINSRTTGSITANGQSVTQVTVGGAAGAVIGITGTWSGQIEFEVSPDGTNYSARDVHDGTNAVNATTGNGLFTLPIAAFTSFRVRASSWSSGTANITLQVGIGAGPVLVVGPLPRGTNVVGSVANIGHVTSTTHVSGLVRAGTGTGDFVCHSTAAIATSASGIVIHASGSNRIFICGVVLVASGAASVSLVEGTGSNCGTNTAAVIGSTDAVNGLALAANGGFVHTAPFPWIATVTAGNNLCLLTSAGRISGSITYRGVP